MPHPTRPNGPRFAAAAVLLACLVLPAGALGGPARPDASFSFTPADPRAGDAVTFVSSSCDPDGRLREQAWDLDGDGAFDDAFGPEAMRVYTSQGIRRVGLRVTDRLGKRDIHRANVAVDTEYALPRPAVERLLSPFPVIRLAGRVSAASTRVRLLAVRAPVCSRVTVTCSGPGCPARRVRARVGRKPLRIRGLEGTLGSGTVIRVLVSKGDRIGKFTRFRIRDDRPPGRMDRCLFPGATKGAPCPED